ncbi:MAG: T9SS type A sorting domain-containing protein, partial [Vicingaceae bacterium]
KVAEVYRDLPVVLFDCPPANFKKNIPSIDLKPALTSLFRQSFDTTIEAGALLELDLRALDSDTLSNPPLHYESITLEVLGRRAMSSTPNNSVACANPPCAYLDSVGNGSWVDSMNAFIDTSKVEARFFWQTGCEHAYTSGNPFGSWPRKSTYTFVIKAFDNRCPLPSVSFKAFNITVYDSTNIPWQIKGVDASTGGAKLDWNNYNLTNFNAYYLYRREIGTAPWNLLNTFTNVNTTNYHDQTALTDQKRYEYVMQVNDPDVCKNGGQVQNVYLTGNLQFNQWIKLNWNRPQSFAGASGNYEVYRKFGNGTWNNIASMSYGTETYTDKPTWQSFYVYYRVDGTDSEGLVTSSNVLTMEVDTPWIGLPEIHEPVVEIIPNPFKNELNIIDMDESLLGQKLTVYNMLGEKVQSHLVTSDRMSFDVSSVKAGVYFVHFTDRNGKSATRRLVKME